MRFEPGVSGNPNGRPKGASSKRTQLSKLLEPHAEELVQKAIEIALTGDVNALRLCIERIIPRAKEENISISQLTIDSINLSDLPTIIANILKAITYGELTLQQGKLLIDMIETQRKMIETSELNTRISSIEQILKSRKIGARHEKT